MIASRSAVYGDPASIVTCTVVVISPALAPNMAVGNAALFRFRFAKSDSGALRVGEHPERNLASGFYAIVAPRMVGDARKRTYQDRLLTSPAKGSRKYGVVLGKERLPFGVLPACSFRADSRSCRHEYLRVYRASHWHSMNREAPRHGRDPEDIAPARSLD
jgi:hypothetical protein